MFKVKKKISIIIDEDRCKGCLVCLKECNLTLLSVSGHTNSQGYHPVQIINKEKCIGCSLCAIVCPDCAIEITSEEIDDENR